MPCKTRVPTQYQLYCPQNCHHIMEVAASIVGLLTAAANVYSTLSAFLSACHDAPTIAQTTSDELRDFHYALLKLRDQVWQSKNITPLGRATTDTSQLILTLASAMTTLAQVEKTLDPLLAQPKKMDYIRRIRWGLADSDLSKLLTRIQSHKLTLNLLLTIWLSESVAHAEASNDLLNDTLKGLLDPRYLSRLQPFDPSIYDSSINDTLHGSTPGITPGDTPGHIFHTPTPFHLGAPNRTDAENMSLVTVDKAFSIMSGKSLRSKLLNTKPYAGLKAFDSSAESVLSSERATPWSEFTIGSNASVFSLPFSAGLNSDKKRISEVKEIHRLSLPIDGMTFYNDWRYPESNISATFPTGALCTLLSIFGLKAKGPRTGMEFKYTNISSLLLQTMSRELALHRRQGGTHSSYLKRKLASGLRQKDLHSIELLLFWSAQKRFGSSPSIRDELVGIFRRAIVKGATQIVELFLEWGAHIEVLHIEPHYEIFDSALKSHSLEIIKLFLIHGFDTEKGYGNPASTPLQATAVGRYGTASVRVATCLLELGVDIEGYCKEEPCTPLRLAINSRNYDMTTLLLAHQANPENGCGNPSCTPLQAAAMGQYQDSLGWALFLLDHGVNIDGYCEEESRTPVELAMRHGNYEVLVFLIDSGANLLKAGYDKSLYRPLQIAAMSRFEQCLDFAQFLLDRGVDIEQSHPNEPRAPLELAVEAGNLKMIALLLAREADPERASYGRPTCTLLQKAAMGLFEDSVGLAKCLLEGGANAEGYCEQEDRKPLELAIEDKNYEMVTLLLAHQANPENGCGNPSCTPLQAAAMGQYQDSLGWALFLLDHGVNIDGYCEEESRTPVELAMRHGNYEVLVFLIDSGANLLKAGYDKSLYRPLQIAAMSRFEQCLDFAQFLLDRGENTEESHINELEPRAPLELAIEAGNLKMIALLLARGADPERASYGTPSCTALQRAAMGLSEDSVGLARCLLENGANVEGCCWKEDRLPLELAMEAGNLKMIALLLARGANPERASYREPRCTPLQKAAMGIFEDSVGLARCLLEGGANVESYCEQESRKPLELAIEYRNYGIIEVLMGCGADPNQGYQCTPLQTLAKGYLLHTTHIMNLLLAGKPNVEGCTETESRTPLQIAIGNRDHEMVKLLLSCGADSSKPYAESTETPIGKVIGDGDLSMLKTLLCLGSDMERGHGSPQRTPLQLVVQMRPINALDMVRWLLDSGANIDGHTDEEPGTPLDIAIRAHNITLAQVLVARGASLEEWSDDALKESTVDRDLN
ncbi:ankyrin repeat-containing domain protein [Morchella snyderi]|nr:ankyrin repeat-containing domain protein [Morchella snyderi]